LLSVMSKIHGNESIQNFLHYAMIACIEIFKIENIFWIFWESALGLLYVES
jgi:hypothetical protein